MLVEGIFSDYQVFSLIFFCNLHTPRYFALNFGRWCPLYFFLLRPLSTMLGIYTSLCLDMAPRYLRLVNLKCNIGCFGWSKNFKWTRIVYPFGIFGRYRSVFSWYLAYQYQRKTPLVNFGIKIFAATPFFPKMGDIGPLLEGLSPLLRIRVRGFQLIHK